MHNPGDVPVAPFLPKIEVSILATFSLYDLILKLIYTFQSIIDNVVLPT